MEFSGAGMCFHNLRQPRARETSLPRSRSGTVIRMVERSNLIPLKSPLFHTDCFSGEAHEERGGAVFHFFLTFLLPADDMGAILIS